MARAENDPTKVSLSTAVYNLAAYDFYNREKVNVTDNFHHLS